MRVSLAITVLLLSTSYSAMAKDVDCSQIKVLNAAEAIACSKKTYAEMNALYEQLFKRFKGVTPDISEDFKKSQKDWLVFRSSYCNFVFNLKPATNQADNTLNTCFTMTNLERLSQFKDF